MSASSLAYLDPGTGSVILQALVGGFAGIVVVAKMGGRRFLSFLPVIGKKYQDPIQLSSADIDAEIGTEFVEAEEADLASLLED